MTARHEISRLGPSRPIPVDGRVVPLWRNSGFADEPLPARAKARRRRSSHTALSERGTEFGGEIFLPANP
jgi:hypothetical protein